MKRIMVVDDEKATVDLLKNILENEGYEIIFAYNGSECIQKMKAMNPVTKPDLFILDIMMPEKNGWDVAAFLKDDKRFNTIPIIFLTAKSDMTSKAMGGLASEFYVEKPFEIDKLLEKIGIILKSKKSGKK